MASASKSFTALGLGTKLFVRNKEAFTYSVSGTFVGTVYLCRTKDGVNFERISSAITGSASGTIVSECIDQGTANYLFICTAYTSGTIVTALTDVTTVVRDIVNSEGVVVHRVNEDGVVITGTQTVSGASTIAGLLTGQAGIVTKVSSANTANPPTQAEMVAAFGAASATGAGFIGIINDNAGGAHVYLVFSDGTNYFQIEGTVGA